MAVIELSGVSKTYRRWRKPDERAVRNLDLTVDEGGVFGFLGPNGSGKTTTIRMLLGLVRPDAGTLAMLGHPVPTDLPKIIGQVGALVETPLFFPAFTGRRNLTLLARASDIALTRVEEMLEFVALRERADERVKGYSLGMKQRLGIAAALLKNPTLLILDEPGNGLDAAGIREMRELIRHLGASGVTVLLSSHQLNEVQQVCDRVAIMSRGAVISHGTVSELLASRSSGEFRLRVPDAARAGAVLAAAGLPTSRPPEDDAGVLRVGSVDDGARVTKVLSDAGIYLSELTPMAAALEDVFLELTSAAASADAGPTAQAPPSLQRTADPTSGATR